jgi:hypothetical protein
MYYQQAPSTPAAASDVSYQTSVANPHAKNSHIVYDVSVKTTRTAAADTAAAASADALSSLSPVASAGASTELTVVERRYSDFEWLHSVLVRAYPTCIIPPIPPKDAHKLLTSKSDQTFVEKRARFLHTFLARVVLHPQLRLSPALHVFLYGDERALRLAETCKVPDLLAAQQLLGLDRFRRAVITLTHTPPPAAIDRDPLTAMLADALAQATVERGGGPTLVTAQAGTVSAAGSSAIFDPATALLYLPHLWVQLAAAGLVDPAAATQQPPNPFLLPLTGGAAAAAAAAAAAGSSGNGESISPVLSAVNASSSAATAALNMLSGFFESVQGVATSFGSKVYVRTDAAAAGTGAGSGAGPGGVRASVSGGASGSGSNGGLGGDGSAGGRALAKSASDVLCDRLQLYAAHVEGELKKTKDAVDSLVKGDQSGTAALGDVSVIARAFAQYEKTQAAEGRGEEAIMANAISISGGGGIITRPTPNAGGAGGGLAGLAGAAAAAGEDALFGSPDIAKVFDMLATATEKVVTAGATATADGTPTAAGGAGAATGMGGAGPMASLLSKVGWSSAGTIGAGPFGGASPVALTGSARAAQMLKEHLTDHAWVAGALGEALQRRQQAVERLQALEKKRQDTENKLQAKPGCPAPPQGAGAEWQGFASVGEPLVRGLQLDVIALREAIAVQRRYVEALSEQLFRDVAWWRRVRRVENVRAVREFAAAMAAAARARAEAWAELESKIKLIQ